MQIQIQYCLFCGERFEECGTIPVCSVIPTRRKLMAAAYYAEFLNDASKRNDSFQAMLANHFKEMDGGVDQNGEEVKRIIVSHLGIVARGAFASSNDARIRWIRAKKAAYDEHFALSWFSKLKLRVFRSAWTEIVAFFAICIIVAATSVYIDVDQGQSNQLFDAIIVVFVFVYWWARSLQPADDYRTADFIEAAGLGFLAAGVRKNTAIDVLAYSVLSSVAILLLHYMFSNNSDNSLSLIHFLPVGQAIYWLVWEPTG